MNQQTIDAYNLHAKNYDEETIDFWNRFPRTFFNKFIELSHGTVLDVGCGPGRDGLVLQEAGLDVVCLDASQVMVEFAKERGLNAVTGDLLALSFADESFDAVWAYTSLLHVTKEEVSQALREIRRVLKPGGIFGLGLIEGEVQEYRESPKVPAPRWFSFYEKEEVEMHLANHAFTIEYFEAFRPNTKNYLNFIARKE